MLVRIRISNMLLCAWRGGGEEEMRGGQNGIYRQHIVRRGRGGGGGGAVTGSLLTAFSQSLLSCVSLCQGTPFFFSLLFSFFFLSLSPFFHVIFLKPHTSCFCIRVRAFIYIYKLISVLFYSLWISLKPTRS